MTLTPHEYARLQDLLARQQMGTLGVWELEELRQLLTKQNPAATTMTTEDLVKLGLFVVGMYALFRIFSK